MPALDLDMVIKVSEYNRLRTIEHVFGMVMALRAEEGDSVEILCDNPEGPPNNAVVIRAWWTEWEEQRFEGSTLAEALHRANLARMRYETKRSKTT